MGIDAGDVNLDGDIDIYITDIPTNGADFSDGVFFSNNLFIHQGDSLPTFVNWEKQSSISAEFSWGVGLIDIENDADPDIYVASNGDSPPETGSVPLQDFLFRNNKIENDALTGAASWDFMDVNRYSGINPPQSVDSHGAVFADYDRDGRVDALIVASGDVKPTLYKNMSLRNDKHWLHVRLVGDHTLDGVQISSKSALGARVLATADITAATADGVATTEDEVLIRDVVSGRSASACTNSLILEFGLGRATECDLTIKWPSGREHTLTNVSADRAIEVTEGATASAITATLY